MNSPPRRRRPYMSAQGREAQRLRILALVKGGLSYDLIAAQEDVPRPHVRKIVIESVGRDPDALDIDRRQVSTALLEPAMKLAELAIARGKLSGIDKLLRVMKLMDKLQPEPKDRVLDQAALEKLRRKFNVEPAPVPNVAKARKSPLSPTTH